MIVRDRIGNEIVEGSMLFWQKLEGPVKVLRMVGTSGIATAAGQNIPPHMIVTLIIGLPTQDENGRPLTEPRLPDFIRCVDPAEQAMLEGAMGGKPQ